MQSVNLGIVDYSVLLIYVFAVIGIGFALKRYMKSSSDFLTSGRSIPSLGDGFGLHLRQPRGSRTGRHGRQRRQIRHCHQPFLLGGRHPRHDLPGRVHDAVLLRLQGPIGARIPEDALRRAHARAQLDLLRGHDCFCLGHLDERAGQTAQPIAALEIQSHSGWLSMGHLRCLSLDLFGHRAGLRAQRRAHLGHLHRSAAVLHDRARLRPGGLSGTEGCRRLGCAERRVLEAVPRTRRALD